jgi:hypothetical protein
MALTPADQGRNVEDIDSKLRLIVDIRSACREQGWPTPSPHRADELLDERAEQTGSSP